MKMYGHGASYDVIPTPETTDVLGEGSEFLGKTPPRHWGSLPRGRIFCSRKGKFKEHP